MEVHFQKNMVNIYVLKLEGEKYYVGKTNHTFQRFNQHATGSGAKWTKKFPVVDLHAFHPNMKDSDENKLTIQMMQNYGVKNVRGGSWTKVDMTDQEIQALENKVSLRKKTRNYRKKSGMFCTRCGRTSHNFESCYARFHADGSVLTRKGKMAEEDFQKFISEYKKNRLAKAIQDDNLSSNDVEIEVNKLEDLQINDPENLEQIAQSYSEEDDSFDLLTLLSGADYNMAKILDNAIDSTVNAIAHKVEKNIQNATKNVSKSAKKASKKLRKFLK